MEDQEYSDEERPGSVPDHPDRPSFRQTPTVNLPPFWSENVAAWFGLAEARFRQKRIYDEWDRYDAVVSSLSQDNIRLVLDIVASPPEDDPYTELKGRLLASHVLTDYQRIERLMAMDALGSRKPSQLLAHMLEICPSGEQRSKFFAFLFLHRLPQELRIMLGEDDHQDVHVLAAKADRLWALHGHRMHGEVAAVAAAQPSPSLNAVRGNPGNKRGAQGRGRGRDRSNLPPKSAAASTTAPAALARDSAGLCFFHWHFGEQANKCEAPCSWQGNGRSGGL
jgi:hypothetical protein